MCGDAHGPSRIALLTRCLKSPSLMDRIVSTLLCCWCFAPEPFYFPNAGHMADVLKYRAKIAGKKNSVDKELQKGTNFPTPREDLQQAVSPGLRSQCPSPRAAERS